MLLEDILLLIMAGVGIFFIGLPIYRFVKSVLPQRRNPLAEAQEHLERARLEAEAAKLNKQAEQLHKETDKLYDEMYQEALQEDDVTYNQEKK